MEKEGIFKHISESSEGVINVRKYTPESSGEKSKLQDLKLEKFGEQETTEKTGQQNAVEEELNKVLKEILTTIKETLQARTTCFCWASQSKKIFFFASKETDSKTFTSKKAIAFSGDALTQVFMARNAQLYTDITSQDEPKILRYYDEPNSVRSFIGVPVFHGDRVYAILFADSIAKSAFGPDDVKLLNRFGKICSAIIDNYATKSKHIEAIRFVEPVINFMHFLQQEDTIEKILDSFTKHLQQTLDFDNLTISLLNSKSELVVKKALGKSETIKEGIKIDLEHSAVGVAFTSGQDGTIDDMETVSDMPLFFKEELKEDQEKQKGSMLIVVLKFKDLYAGVLTLQTEQKRNFGKDNFTKVRYFAETLSMVLHTKLLKEQLKTERPLDEETGTLSRKHFVSRVRHEVNRASRENQSLILMMVAFDEEASLVQRYGKENMMKLMQSTARLIVANMRNYDLISRLDSYRFSICLINISEVNARQWADKIREQILNSPFDTGLEFQSILASVSVGLAELRLSNPDIDHLFQGARTALEHALKSGNSVKVF